MLIKLVHELNFFIIAAKTNIILLIKLMATIWAINIANWIIGSPLNYFGVRPRKTIGLIGIFIGTFLHKNFNHLFFNSIPLFALALFMMSFGLKAFYLASCIIILLEGILIWFIGRSGVHIGASSLITGYFSFVLVSAYVRPTFTTLFIAVIVLYYFGSIFFSLFPSEEKTSWEGHLLGFISGLVAYFCTIEVNLLFLF